MKKYFGTDGIRGVMGTPPMTADWILKLGWAIGAVLTAATPSNIKPKVIIGKDTRISGYILETSLQAGLLSAGVDCLLLGPIPTPAISYFTQKMRVTAGIVISASHNPYEQNGIKIFSSEGEKLSDELESKIEKMLNEPFETVKITLLGKANRFEQADHEYSEFCKNTVPDNLKLNNLKIILDCANGATYRVGPKIFMELGAEIIAINASPDGYNINLNCGATDAASLQNCVIDKNADIGIAFDGDGDRVIMVDHTGAIVDGDELIYIIAKWYLDQNKNIEGVVGTQMSNLGLEIALKKLGIKFFRTQVGDRYVLEGLKQKHWKLGGEPSGHIICLDTTSTGDGIISALCILSICQSTGKNLYQLKQEMIKYPQILINIPCDPQKILLEHPKVQKAIKDIEEKMNGTGRVLVRYSGTESLLRVMLEGKDLAQIELLAKDLIEKLKKEIVT